MPKNVAVVVATDSAHRVPVGARGRVVAVARGAAADGGDIYFLRFSYTKIPGVFYDSFVANQVRPA